MMNYYNGWGGYGPGMMGGYEHPWLWGPVLGVGALAVGAVIALVVLWSLVWKGFALWKAAKLGHKGWFIALLIINTAGILEILYIYIFSRKYHPRVHQHDHMGHEHGHKEESKEV